MSPFRICLPLFTSAFSFVNCACVHVCSHTRHSVRAEVRSQLEGVASLPLPCEARDELVQAWCQHYLRVISSPHRVFCSRVSPWDQRSPFRLGLAGRQPQGSFSRPPQYRCYKYLQPCSHQSSWQKTPQEDCRDFEVNLGYREILSKKPKEKELKGKTINEISKTLIFKRLSLWLILNACFINFNIYLKLFFCKLHMWVYHIKSFLSFLLPLQLF